MYWALVDAVSLPEMGKVWGQPEWVSWLGDAQVSLFRNTSLADLIFFFLLLFNV